MWKREAMDLQREDPPPRKFESQFFNLYTSRLEALRERTIRSAKTLWGDNMKILDRILEIQGRKDMSEEVICVGILHMEVEINLDQLLEQRGYQPPDYSSPYSKKRNFFIEDLSGKIRVIPPPSNPQVFTSELKVVTGMVVAIKCIPLPSGDIEFRAICFPEPDKVKDMTPAPRGGGGGDVSIMIVSGFWNAPLGLRVMLIDFLTGQSGSEEDQEEASRISNLILCGGGCNPLEATTDSMIYELGLHMTVDILPGEEDPTTFSFPQISINKSMFKRSSTLSSIHCVSNPHTWKMESSGVSIVGSSGQNMRDFRRYFPPPSVVDDITIMKSQIDSCHISPTSPSTLHCPPFTSRDPFIFQQSPSIYFCSSSASDKIMSEVSASGTLLLPIPPFSSTGRAVVISIHTSNPEASVTSTVINFSIPQIM